MTDTRRQIHAHVSANVGIHFNELVRESDFATGQIQYHVRRLVDDGDLDRDEFYGRTHFYPPGFDERERHVIALFRRETTRDIVVFLIECEPTTPATVADELGIARSTLEHHLSRLVEQRLVEKRYDEHNRVSLHLVDPDQTASFLRAVSPTVPDRLVDRFTRLVDGLLEDQAGP